MVRFGAAVVFTEDPLIALLVEEIILLTLVVGVVVVFATFELLEDVVSFDIKVETDEAFLCGDDFVME